MVLALDDGQRLNWPRERLPAGAAEGMVVVLDLEHTGGVISQAAGAGWTGTVGMQTQSGGAGIAIQLGQQRLDWPAVEGFSTGERVVVRMQVDAEDMKRRHQQVLDLIDDLFS